MPPRALLIVVCRLVAKSWRQQHHLNLNVLQNYWTQPGFASTRRRSLRRDSKQRAVAVATLPSLSPSNPESRRRLCPRARAILKMKILAVSNSRSSPFATCDWRAFPTPRNYLTHPGCCNLQNVWNFKLAIAREKCRVVIDREISLFLGPLRWTCRRGGKASRVAAPGSARCNRWQFGLVSMAWGIALVGFSGLLRVVLGSLAVAVWLCVGFVWKSGFRV